MYKLFLLKCNSFDKNGKIQQINEKGKHLTSPFSTYNTTKDLNVCHGIVKLVTTSQPATSYASHLIGFEIHHIDYVNFPGLRSSAVWLYNTIHIFPYTMVLH